MGLLHLGDLDVRALQTQTTEDVDAFSLEEAYCSSYKGVTMDDRGSVGVCTFVFMTGVITTGFSGRYSQKEYELMGEKYWFSFKLSGRHISTFSGPTVPWDRGHVHTETT